MGNTERLLIELITIVPATGIEGAQMIASDSLSCPHLVKQSKSGKFSCHSDGQYPMCGGQKICAHTVAVAECVHRLPDFLNFLHKSKPECNLTKLGPESSWNKVWKSCEKGKFFTSQDTHHHTYKLFGCYLKHFCIRGVFTE